jgi:hypothetical protein
MYLVSCLPAYHFLCDRLWKLFVFHDEYAYGCSLDSRQQVFCDGCSIDTFVVFSPLG